MAKVLQVNGAQINEMSAGKERQIYRPAPERSSCSASGRCSHSIVDQARENELNNEAAIGNRLERTTEMPG